MHEKSKNNLTDQPNVTYSNSMPEDIESQDRSVSETPPSSLGNSGISVEQAFSAEDENFQDALTAKLEQIAKEAKEKAAKQNTQEDKAIKEQTKANDTQKTSEKETPEDIESKLTKKEKKLVSRIVKALDPTQKASFFSRLKFALKGAAYEDLSEVVKEEEMIKTDYKPKTVKEVGNPESFKRFVGNGGGLRNHYDSYVNGLVRRLRDEGIDDEKVLEVRKHAEADYAQNIQNVKNILNETGDYKKVRAKLAQLGSNFDRFDTYLDHLKHDDVIEAQIYKDLAMPLEELVEITDSNPESTKLNVPEPKVERVIEVSNKDSDRALVQSSVYKVDDEPIEERQKGKSVAEDTLQNESPAKDRTESQDEVLSITHASVQSKLLNGEQSPVQEANGRLKIDPEIVRANAILDDEARIKKAAGYLGIEVEDLTHEQQQAILQAHYIGVGEVGRDEQKAGEFKQAHIYNYTHDQLKQKAKILKKHFKDPEQRRLLMEYGITGAFDAIIADHYKAEGITPPDFVLSSLRDEKGKLKSPDTLREEAMTKAQSDVVYRSIEEDVMLSESPISPDQYQVDETGPLQEMLADESTFRISDFQRNLGNMLFRLSKVSKNASDIDKQMAESIIGEIGQALPQLSTFNENIKNIETKLEALKFAASQAPTTELKIQIQQLEQEQQNIKRNAHNLSNQIVQRVQDGFRPFDRLYNDSDNPGEGDSPPPYGGEDNPPPPSGDGRLRGRGESGDEEDEPFGRSVRSIEDIGHFMELLVDVYKGKIMASLYKLDDGTIVNEDDLEKAIPGISEKPMENAKRLRRVYAYKVGQGEYARDYDDMKVPDYYNDREKYPPNQRGNRVLMLSAQEIRDLYPDDWMPDGRPRPPESSRSQGRQQTTKDYWEAVKVVRPDMYMSWMRYYWDYLHNDDPDNPANFFQGVVVAHPDQRGAVNAEAMHKGAGTYLRSRFLTDPANGELRVFNQLKNEIVNEMWVPSTERNNEVLYKKIMHADEELPKVVRDQIVAGNLLAKTAAGGKNTLATFFTLPEHFHDEFDSLTGETFSDKHKMEKKDVKLGQAILLAYQIYYNIGDYDGLERLLGREASIFNRDAIVRATLQEMQEYAPSEITEKEVQMAKGFLRTEDEATTVLDDKYYDSNGTGRVKDKNSPDYDPEAFKEWMTFMNPFYPVQKDDKQLKVIRRVVRNQMQEILRLDTNDSLAELHAYLRTYHDGLAARHDTGMGNRNAQSKYEFIEAYQDKQNKRDRSGNKYNKGIVKRTIVGMLHGMPTRNGETVQDVLQNAINIQLDGVQTEEGKLVGSLEYVNLLNEKKQLHKKDGSLKRYRDSFQEMINNGVIADTFEGSELDKNIKSKLDALLTAKVKYDEDPSKENKEVSIAWKQRQNDEIDGVIEIHLRNIHEDLMKTHTEYEANKAKLTQQITKTLDRLEFDEAQYTQYGGMHYSNGTALFLEEMESHDLPLDEIRGRDYDGRLFFKTDKFGPWLESMEKRMRYTIETWPLPLGAMERRLVNPRSGDNVPPEYIDMPLVESIFGSTDSRVLKMAQLKIHRDVEEKNRDREKNIKEAKQNFNKGKISREELETIQLNNKPLDKWDYTFCDSNGSIADKDKNGKPVYNSDLANALRTNLRRVVGFIEYDEENGRKKGIKKTESALIKDPASEFTKSYVKVRIANFLLSHTESKSPYEKWTVQQREDFLQSLILTNYFTRDDINDIRNFSKNTYWGNFNAEAKRNLKKAMPEMFTGFFKEFANIFK